MEKRLFTVGAHSFAMTYFGFGRKGERSSTEAAQLMLNKHTGLGARSLT